MHREILIACAPYVAAIFASSGLLYLLMRFSGARLQLAHVKNLNRDQQGGVQSLSFVLTLPLFVMILMFIVQLSQITIATVVVEYAAFAAARAAMVWIPAETSSEYANQIGVYRQTGASSSGANTNGYAVYQVDPTGLKFQKIHFAAAMACMPICPSRNTGVSANHPSMPAQTSLAKAYQAMAPTTASNSKIPTRLTNKLAYALNNTHVYIEVHHPLRVDLGADYPLDRPLTPNEDMQLNRPAYPREFAANEYGWQDQLYVTVKHDFALLPGPGRLLARQDSARPGEGPETSPGQDRIAQSLTKRGDAYARTISATVRLNNEGQKSSLPYYQTIFGQQPPNTAASDYAASNEKEEDDSADNENENESGDDECCGNEVGDEAGQVNEDGERDGMDRAGNNPDGEQHQGGDNQGQDGREGDRPREGDGPQGDKPAGKEPPQDGPQAGNQGEAGQQGGDRPKDGPKDGPAGPGDKPKEGGDKPEPRPPAGNDLPPKDGPAGPGEKPKEGGDKPEPRPPAGNDLSPKDGDKPVPGDQPAPKPDGAQEKPASEPNGESSDAK